MGIFRGSIRPRRTIAAAAALGLACISVATVHSAAPAAADDCADVGIVKARGTGEPQSGSLLLTPLAHKIAGDVDGNAAVTELTYPAEGDFATSTPEGIENLVELLDAAAEQCPDQHHVLPGYSQGAMVIGDTLVDPDQRQRGQELPAPSEPALENVAATVFFGDPHFTAGEPFNAGTFAPEKSGVEPRSPGDLDAHADRLRSYCNKNDSVCQTPGGNFAAHLGYFINDTRDQAREFVAGQLTG